MLPRCGIMLALAVVLSAPYCSVARADGYVNLCCDPQWSPSLELSELEGSPAPDVTSQTYSVIAAPGGAPTSVTVASGYTLGTVIGGLGPYLSPPFGFAEIAGPGGHGALVPYSEIIDPPASDPPVFWGDASGIHFADGSPSDYITEPATSQGIDIYLHSGSILTVDASASVTGTVAIDEPVQFTLDAPVSGQSAGESLTYQWIFDDGSTSSQQSPMHKYVVPGTYDAYLRVVGSDDSLGYSAMIPITVGKTPKGPDRQGGGTSTNKKSPTSGAGVRGAKSKATAKSNASTSAGNTSSQSGSNGTPRTSMPTPSVTTAATNPQKPNIAKPDMTHRTTESGPGRLLTGIAIGAARVASARTRTSASPRGTPNPARTGHITRPSGAPGQWLWITLAAILALLAGALLEWNGTPQTSPRHRLATP